MARLKTDVQLLDYVVSDWSLFFSVSERKQRITHQNSRQAIQALFIHGTTEKVYKNCTEVEIFVLKSDRSSEQLETADGYPPSVGTLEKKKDVINARVSLTATEYDLLFSLACSGQLKFCSLVVESPSARYAPISSFSFSNRKIG
jgi:hypothetical protein